ncbi:MAG: LysR family transcriptional regulator [Spirochaetaceae bacterium]|nr:LysR family transcriptional regulator [Spirochaetaceae bacterium]
MTLQQLKYAVAVAECGNVTAASQKVFISQPSLTTAIHELENEIGITIFSRTNKGVVVTNEGDEFLGYARQVLEQAFLIEEKYLGKEQKRSRFSVTCQHYSFAVNAFVDVIKQFGGSEYDYTLRESRTSKIIDDVSRLKSEIGILYMNKSNSEVISKLLKKNDLVFSELFTAKPHVFISKTSPLAKKERITLEDLKPFPYLTYEQGEYNSFYFSEEPLPDIDHKLNIKVSDRATLFNLLIGLDGYTVCSGVIDSELNGINIIARPLELDDFMRIGTVTHKSVVLSRYAQAYIAALKKYI